MHLARSWSHLVPGTPVPRTIATALMLVLAGCSTGGGTEARSPAASGTGRASMLGAAEPVKAPAGSATPTGTLWSIGAASDPEGAVYDAATNTLAIAVQAPPRLLLLDPATGAVRASAPLPGTARHLQLAAPGGPVVVPCESSNSLVQVTLPTGTVRSITPVGRQPHDAAALPDGRVVVGNEFGRSLSVISAPTSDDTGHVVVQRTIPGVIQPGGVAAVSDSEVAVVDVYSHTISTFDANTGTRTGVLPAGDGPTHGVLVRAGSSDPIVVVADTRGDRLLTFGLDPLRQLTSIPLSGAPYGLAVDDQRESVWVTLTGLNQVAGFSLATDTPIEFGRYATVTQPNSVAVAPGSQTVWVAGHADGNVEAITRTTG